MKLDQFDQSQVYKCQTEDLYQRFTLKQIAQARPEEILDIIMEKDKMIQAFSQQITKFKAGQLKAKKLISSLQQKIQKALPSANNTSNSFMIPSQFKTLFITFMTSTVPSVFYDFTQNPKIYSILLKSILQGLYDKIQSVLQQKIQAIRLILLQENKPQLDKSNVSNQQNTIQDLKLREQIRFHLLSFLQKYFKRIIPTQFNQIQPLSEQIQSQQPQNEDQQSRTLFHVQMPTQSFLDQQIRQKIEALNSQQTQTSQELKQFSLQLYQICIYMLLQQNPWQFVFDLQAHTQNQENKLSKLLFTKKQFTCIDGFVKQGCEVKMVLKGLRRRENSSKEYHYHPNIKNFVLPSNNQGQETPQKFQIKTNFIFFKKFESEQKISDDFSKKITNEDLRDIKNLPQDLISSKLSNPPFLSKYLPKQITAPSKDLLQKMQNSLPVQKPKIVSQQSFRIQAISQTQKSELIQSSLMRKQTPLIENESNCIIDLTQSCTLKRKQSNKQNMSNSQEDKENLHENINSVKPDKKLSTNSKKEKSVVQKNMMKKNKKEKNNSTIDLTSQKHKANQKQHLKDNTQSENAKRKHQQFPLTREIPKSSKKKAVGKSSRKCSVGKIISQSTQMTGSSTHTKQKISLSQHNTLVMKEPLKPLKENIFPEGSQRIILENKQNMGAFVGHMYEKQIMRPKKSTKIAKNEEKPLVLVGQKEERPLALRAYQNGCLVGKLREKYLIG